MVDPLYVKERYSSSPAITPVPDVPWGKKYAAVASRFLKVYSQHGVESNVIDSRFVSLLLRNISTDKLNFLLLR
jgi:hypothetical protein